MDYKCNSTIIVGIYANGTTSTKKNAIIYLNTKEDWNKIYLSLSEVIANYREAISYRLFFAIQGILHIIKTQCILTIFD